jgi:threonine/homoserine/homoserine lactone efflux protein
VTIASAAALFGTLVVLSLAPGPTEIALVARSTSHGYATGAAMVAGILVADALLIAIAFTGLATVAASIGDLSFAISILAAAFLVYLGIGQLSRPSVAPGLGAATGQITSFSAGLTLTLADPKALFGYAALLPAFVDLTHACLVDALVVLFLATIAICIAKGLYITLAHRASASFFTPRASLALNRASGGALVVVAIALLAQAVSP